MIEQEAYKSFLDVAEYGKIGIDHFKKVFDELAKRLEDYEKNSGVIGVQNAFFQEKKPLNTWVFLQV